MAMRRLYKEIKEIQNEPIENIEIKFDPSNIFEWAAFITGPQDSPYEGRVYEVVVKFPTDYPFKPPKVNLPTICIRTSYFYYFSLSGLRIISSWSFI